MKILIAFMVLGLLFVACTTQNADDMMEEKNDNSNIQVNDGIEPPVEDVANEPGDITNPDEINEDEILNELADY